MEASEKVSVASGMASFKTEILKLTFQALAIISSDEGIIVICSRSSENFCKGMLLTRDNKQYGVVGEDCDESPWKAVSHQDKFFVSYPTAGCVKTFNKDGDFLYDIGDELAGEGQLSKPRGLVDLVLIPITTWRFVTRKTKR
ncbi:hypothetical protein pdam_00020587 [Pocillopora damicornis]|uniref:Uncharacterized protein n=1 Tax=Pocillopora damicornis TaxID=46731 RepID=A0A3M6UUP7_POCDA|nr:hypothetical protein pdam_00020587 [Pocillopora damicornis]